MKATYSDADEELVEVDTAVFVCVEELHEALNVVKERDNQESGFDLNLWLTSDSALLRSQPISLSPVKNSPLSIFLLPSKESSPLKTRPSPRIVLAPLE